MKRDLALEHAADRIGDASYFEQMGRLRAESGMSTVGLPAPVDPTEAVAFIDGIAATWELAHARGTGPTRASDLRARHRQGPTRGPSEAHADGGAHGAICAVA